MCGAEAVYQINTLLRSDPAVSRAFGRERCADQSTIQETLAACTPINVLEMQTVLKIIFQKTSRAIAHAFSSGPLVLDIDITGLPCGRHLEGATKGYFAGCKPGRVPTGGCGRQLYRVSASQYDEVVYQQVCPGNIGSSQLAVFKQVIEATWDILKLTAQAKGRVLIRLDSGYGTTDIISYLWSEGYQFITKMFATSRARKLGRAGVAAEWHSDPCHTGRACTILNEPHLYTGGERKLYQIGVRCQLAEKSQAKRAAHAQAKCAKTGKVQLVDEYEYSVLLVFTEALADLNALTSVELVEQLHFYDASRLSE